MIMKNFTSFYRNRGIRFKNQVTTPPISRIEDVVLPLNSVYFFLGDGVSHGPQLDRFPFVGYPKTLRVEHVTKYDVVVGDKNFGIPKPVSNFIAGENVAMTYHRNTPKTVKVKNILGMNIAETEIAVKSYAIASLAYFYPDKPVTPYFRDFFNKWNTIINDLKEDVSSTKRNIFFELPIPELKISFDTLLQRSKAYTFGKLPEPRLRRILTTEAEWLFLNLFLFCGTEDERSRSMFSKISVGDLGKLNFIIRNDRYATVLNVGTLFSFIKTEDNNEGWLPIRLQKSLFISMVRLGNIKEVTTNETEETEEEINSKLLSAAKDKTALVVEVRKTRKGEFVSQTVDVETINLIKHNRSMAKADAAITDAEDDDEELSLPSERTDETISEDELDKIITATDVIDSSGGDNINLDNQDQEINPDDPDVVLATDREPILPAKDPIDGVRKEIYRLGRARVISAGEIQKFEVDATKFLDTELNDIFQAAAGKGLESTMDDLLSVTPEDTKLKPRKIVGIKGPLAEGMDITTIEEVDKQYNQKLLLKDCVRNIVAFQKRGVIVSDLAIERKSDVMADFYEITVSMQMVGGAPAIQYYRIPVVQEDGTILSKGIKYYLKTQVVDVPIRKVGPRRVVLTSHYGKLSIVRLEHNKLNYTHWLTNKISAIGINAEDQRITKMVMGKDSFNKELKTHPSYSAIGSKYRSFVLKTAVHELMLDFDYKEMAKIVKPATLNDLLAKNAVPIGFNQTKNLVSMSFDGIVCIHGASLIELGSIEELLGLDYFQRPVEIVTMNVMGKTFPLTGILCYHLGISGLLRLAELEPKFIPANQRYRPIQNSKVNEQVFQFKDYKMIVDLHRNERSLLLSGLRFFGDNLRAFKVSDLNSQEAMVALFVKNGLPNFTIRELDIIYDMFVDPVTEGLLKKMNEPTDMLSLYLRCIELLATDQHPAEVDGRLTRLRGYERFAETIYQETLKAYRMGGDPAISRRKAKFSVNREAVMKSILLDPAMEVTNDINPIQNLKQKEIATHGGKGGRSADTMVKRTRVFNNSEGIISEAGVDSGSTGVIIYTPPNPKLDDLYGMPASFSNDSLNSTNYFSSAALVSPCAEHDDAKRVVFIGVQHGHTISTEGSEIPLFRTNYDAVIPHRVDKQFAAMAKGDGKVVSIKDNVIRVEYKDGSVDAIELGTIFGKSAGSTYPHRIVSDLKEGDSFREGDCLAYNTNFFAVDKFYGNLSMKMGVRANFLLHDTLDTFEDGSTISLRLAEKLKAPTTYTRQVTLRFDQIPHNLVKVGDEISFDTILCTIQEPVMQGDFKIDEQALRNLQEIAQDSPLAKTTGFVEGMEVYYNGDVADMNPQLKQIVMEADGKLIAKRLQLGKPTITGSVPSDFRVNGNLLEPNSVVINIHISKNVAMGVSDKLVIGNQMKATVSRVKEEPEYTADGIQIDGDFAFAGVHNRIVESIMVIGTTNMVLYMLGKKFVKIAKGLQ